MSATGRVTNLLVRRARPAYKWGWRAHRWVFERTGGRRFTTVAGAQVCRLTVDGRRSGKARSVLVIYVRRGEDLVVCASHAGHPRTPDWYRNLVASGRATVMVDGVTWPVRARTPEGAERQACWALMTEAFPLDDEYQSMTDRRFPLAVLEPVGAAG